MTDYPHFSAFAPEAFADARIATRWLHDLLTDLAQIVKVSAENLGNPTVCREFTVEQLRDHMTGWLCRFADALDDVDAADRLDPDAHHAGPEAAQTVLEVRDRIEAALAAGALTRRHLVAAATMDGSAMVAMMTSEYIVHGWDLAQATGQPWRPDPEACEAALDFLRGIVAPEHRGDQGMFAHEVPVASHAPVLDRLLGFTGRAPGE